MAMIEDLRLWIGKDVVDAEEGKVGKLADVYFDVESDQPLFLVVDTGRRHEDFLVPAWNAATAPDHVSVAYPPDALKGAPRIDRGVGLTLEEEAGLFAYFNVTYERSNAGSGRRLMRR